MGLFDDLDLANAEDRPKLVGKFSGNITGAEIQIGSTNNPDAVMIVIETTLDLPSGGQFPMKKWFMVPQGAPSSWSTTERPTKSGKGTTSDFQDNQRSRTALKEFFKSLNFAPEVMASVNEDTIAGILVGTPVSVTVGEQRGSEYSEIKRFARAGNSGVTAPVGRPVAAPASAPAAAPVANVQAPVATPANNPFAK